MTTKIQITITIFNIHIMIIRSYQCLTYILHFKRFNTALIIIANNAKNYYLDCRSTFVNKTIYNISYDL